MKTADFIRKYDACPASAKWALSISDDMADVWDALIAQDKHDWLIWTVTRPGVFPDSVLRKLACRFVRETPLADGRKVWDLLTDERSRMAVEVSERYVDGNATVDELSAAYDSARDASAAAEADEVAAYAAANAAYAAANAAHAAASARSAARAASWAAEASAAYSANAAAANAAYAAAFSVARAADCVVCAVGYVARAAADADHTDAYAAAYDAAKSAQVKTIAELGNPFNQKE
jgi:hypothetical protein